MTVKVELDEDQVIEAVQQYAERMMPPGWFECHSVDEVKDGSFVVSLKPVPGDERPQAPPEVAPPAGEAQALLGVCPPALPPMGGFTNNGISVTV